MIYSVFALSACGGTSAPADPKVITKAEISHQWQLWDARKANVGYTIEYTPQCYCSNLPAKVRVTTNSAGTKHLVELLDSNGNIYQQLGQNDDLSQYFNIDNFFQYMDGPWSAKASLSGKFDAEYGFPTSIYSSDLSVLSQNYFGYEIKLTEIL